MVTPQGFEPCQRESESLVLPLHYGAIRLVSHSKCPTRVRTLTRRIKISCATITPWGRVNLLFSPNLPGCKGRHHFFPPIPRLTHGSYEKLNRGAFRGRNRNHWEWRFESAISRSIGFTRPGLGGALALSNGAFKAPLPVGQAVMVAGEAGAQRFEGRGLRKAASSVGAAKSERRAIPT